MRPGRLLLFRTINSSIVWPWHCTESTERPDLVRIHVIDVLLVCDASASIDVFIFVYTHMHCETRLLVLSREEGAVPICDSTVPGRVKCGMDGQPGWYDLFHVISEFLLSSSRQFSSANEEYIEYVLERLSICIRTVSAVTNRVDEEVDEESDHTLFQVHRALKDMVGCLKSLRRLWSEQLNTLASRFDLVRYRAPLASEAAGVGRPKFESMSCSLKQINDMACHQEWGPIRVEKTMQWLYTCCDTEELNVTV